MSRWNNTLADWLDGAPEYYVHIVESMIIIMILLFIRFIAVRIIYKRQSDLAVQYKWKKYVGYILSFFGFLIIGRIWFEGIGSLATFLGLLSAGIAIALRDPIVDMAGWLFLLWRKPFNLGDRIQIGDVKGDVIDLRLFKFTVLEIGNWVDSDQSTGRVIHVPNHTVFRDSIANYTSDFEFIWNELVVVITFLSNWRKAKQILLEIAEDHLQDFVQDAESQVKRASKSYLIYYKNLTPIVYTSVEDNGVKLTLRHLSYPRRRRDTSQILWEDILDKFNAATDIDFAYNTLRIYQHHLEGKEELRNKS